MGNRAVITTERAWTRGGLGIYIHWNGGRDSVESFLEYCRIKGYADPAYNESSALARLTQVIANFFGGTASIEVGLLGKLNMQIGDNGVYIIGKDWKITDRKYFHGREQDVYSRQGFLESINGRMPEDEQFPAGFFEAEEKKAADLRIGDQVFYRDPLTGKVTLMPVLGYGSGMVNGSDRTGQPYIGRFASEDHPASKNPNNYFDLQENIRVFKED